MGKWIKIIIRYLQVYSCKQLFYHAELIDV